MFKLPQDPVWQLGHLQMRAKIVKHRVCNPLTAIVPTGEALAAMGTVKIYPKSDMHDRNKYNTSRRLAVIVMAGQRYAVLRFTPNRPPGKTDIFGGFAEPIYPEFTITYDRLVPRRAACS